MPAGSERVLLLAPVGRDARLTGKVLDAEGIACTPCHALGELREELGKGAEALLLTEEALPLLERLGETLHEQPAWSELPIVLLADRSRSRDLLRATLARAWNVTVLARPMERATLISAVRSALRARRRQYQVRDLLAELREANEQLEERVRARVEELGRSESRFREVFDAAPIPIVLTDGDDRVLDVNEAFERLTGYAREEAVGRRSRELRLWSPPEEQERLRASGGEDGRNLEARVRTADGRELEVLLSEARVEFDSGPGMVRMFLDITQRKQTERQLQQALQDVLQDTTWLAHSVMEKLAQARGKPREATAQVADLTRREREVLALLAAARSNEAISEELGLAPTTVRNYISSVYTKIGAASRAEAIVWARERGITGP